MTRLKIQGRPARTMASEEINALSVFERRCKKNARFHKRRRKLENKNKYEDTGYMTRRRHCRIYKSLR